MNQKIIYDYKFDNMQLKKLDIVDSSELRAFYHYHTDTIFLNIGCLDYEDYKVDKIIKVFALSSQHENIHREIHKITKGFANDIEERFVKLMTGEIK